jgi:hypothetical protein
VWRSAKFSTSRLSVLVVHRQLPMAIRVTGRGLEVVPLDERMAALFPRL